MKKLVAAVGILEDPNRPGIYLLGMRKSTDRAYPGCWEMPGGKIDEGENWATAVQREWMEELGTEVTPDPGGHFYEEDFQPTPTREWTIQAGRVYARDIAYAAHAHSQFAWVSAQAMLCFGREGAACVPSLYPIAAALLRASPMIASGDCTCPQCGECYGRHGRESERTRVLCNGTRVLLLELQS